MLAGLKGGVPGGKAFQSGMSFATVSKDGKIFDQWFQYPMVPLKDSKSSSPPVVLKVEVSGKGPVTLVSDRVIGAIDADNSNADGVPTAVSELDHLPMLILLNPATAIRSGRQLKGWTS